MGVVPLHSVDPVTGGVPVTGSVPVTNVKKRNKQPNNNNALRLGFKPIRSGILANGLYLP